VTEEQRSGAQQIDAKATEQVMLGALSWTDARAEQATACEHGQPAGLGPQ
jgi:hypothetical protein